MPSEPLSLPDDVKRFLAALFDPDDWVEVRLIWPNRDDGKPTPSRWCRAGELASNADLITWMKEQNAASFGVYFGANPRKNRGGTKSEHVAIFRALFVDFDGVSLEEARRQVAAAGLPEPSIWVISGHGAHAYWLLRVPLTDAAEWTQRQKAMIAMCPSADRAIHDPPRVMRAPGYMNTKKPEAMCTLAECDPERRHEINIFPEGVAATESPPTLAAPAGSDERGKLSRRTLEIISNGFPEPGRNNALFRAATDMQGCRYTQAEAEERLVPSLLRCGLSEHEIKSTIASAYAKDRTPSRPDAWNQEAVSGGEAVWSPPQPLYGRAPSFPLAEAFPAGTEALRDYISAVAESFQVPVDLPATLVMGASGLALSKRAVVRLRPDWVQPPNHYFATLMEPGNRKTAPFYEVASPVYEYEAEIAEQLGPEIARARAEHEINKKRLERLKDIAAGKGRKSEKDLEMGDAKAQAIDLEKQLAAEKQLEVPQLLITDCTSEELGRRLEANGERIGVFSDESEAIEIFMGRYDGKPNLQLYNKGYDGSPHRTNRVGRTPVILKQPLISVAFVIQPEAVREMMEDRKAKGTGLLARFALELPHSLLGHRKVNPEAIPGPLRGRWKGTILHLLRVDYRAEDGPVEIPLTPQAAAEFCDFCAQIEPSLSWCGDFAAYGIQDWGGKLAGRIARIALCLHGLRLASSARNIGGEIGVEVMRSAMEWAPYLIEHAQAVAGWMSSDTASSTARRILAWIARTTTQRFSRRDAFIGVRSAHVKKVEDLDPPLSLLVELGYIRRLPDPEAKAQGRPSSAGYIVNPLWKGAGL